MTTITEVTTRDARFTLQSGEGVDAVHSNPQYSYAVTHLKTNRGHCGTGLAFTLGGGNDLVCQFIHPADVREGVYRTPEEPGSSSDLIK